ncbi:cupin domain-containing protein [Kitasatospora azatica]|uniref:cupin domain-containing protein n=1 Tax=Kitasatospora azatica TaxID=58347 RepID=UPI00055C14C3|nr:cupin domain-containing protein [Kitasatospora azatica]
MSVVNVFAVAAELPAAWKSQVLGQVGTACMKVLRMDELPVEEEAHGAAEALLVLDGRLELVVDGESMTVGPGELFLVPAGARHSVGAGSRGTLVIVEVPEKVPEEVAAELV